MIKIFKILIYNSSFLHLNAAKAVENRQLLRCNNSNSTSLSLYQPTLRICSLLFNLLILKRPRLSLVYHASVRLSLLSASITPQCVYQAPELLILSGWQPACQHCLRGPDQKMKQRRGELNYATEVKYCTFLHI